MHKNAKHNKKETNYRIDYIILYYYVLILYH